MKSISASVLNKDVILVNKQLGETPLEALERTRIAHGLGPVPMTYAGRLDPMAEGLLIVLVGEECKRKDAYLDLDKVYETEFLLGMETDTHDLLGLVTVAGVSEETRVSNAPVSREQFELVLKQFVGKRKQTYPAFSSKPHDGRPLFELARAGELPSEDEMPSREVEIYRIEVLGERVMMASELEKQILERIALVNGDFRQTAITVTWQEFFQKKHNVDFQLFSLRVHCSSGTYIRSLAHEAGRLLKSAGSQSLGAIAFSIKRTQVGKFILA